MSRPALFLLALLAGACALQPGVSALISYKRATESLRGLEFQRRFDFEFIDREQIPGLVRKMVEAAYPPGHVEAYRDAYAALGALPADIDLEQALLELQQDQLLGLYDPHTETMYVVRSGPDDDYQAATIIHELVHALQHQHFPELFAVQQTLRHNDDLVSALSTAIEGDASLTMLARLPRRDRSVLTAGLLREVMLLDIQYPEGKLAEVPRLLRVSLLFGYAHGTSLAAVHYERAGNAGLDQFLRDPPIATVNALEPDQPVAVEFVSLPLEPLGEALAARGCSLGHHNVAGALTVGVIFEDHEGQDRAPGLDLLLADWKGDRFVHARCGDQWELAWLTRWRSEAAANAFASRYRGIAASIAVAAPLSGEPELMRAGRTVLVYTPGLVAELELILDGAEIRRYPSLASWIGDDCFTESPCPTPAPDPAVAPLESGATPPRSRYLRPWRAPVAQLDRAGDF